MAKALDRYYAKRDFGITPEPRGTEHAPGARLSYVIQKHAARRLHYDFRLELDGVLKSWAVPKGPSLDPADKRMAVATEDHPMEYAGFEGDIPADQYGAGHVIVWDRGEWIPLDDPREGYRNGKLKFELRGEKLRGIWNLVRMKGRAGERQESWLLIKERDEASRPSDEYSIVNALPHSVLGTDADNAPTVLPTGAKRGALPDTLAPQLATLVTDVPRRGAWLYEVKYDGYRILTRFKNGSPRLFTRNGNDWTDRLKTLATDLKRLGIAEGWLDGEIVILGSNGNPDFQSLQNAFDSARTDAIQYFIFDVPFFGGQDLRQAPLHARRDFLAGLLAHHESDRVHFSDDFDVPAGQLLSTACEMRLEGVIGKLRDAPYESRRSPSWIKLKCSERQEFVIAGYTDPKHAGRGVGALLLAFHDSDGTLRYAGKVGTGFTEQSGRALARQLSPLESPNSPFAKHDKANRGHRAPVHWVEPRLLAEVSFHEWTQDGHIRHAVFHGLRGDKPATAIVRETAKPANAVAPDNTRGTPWRKSRKSASDGAAKTSRRKTATRAEADDGLQLRPDLGGVRITHPERVIDNRSGATKQALAAYYARVADYLLPHLAERPVAMVRGPSGVDGKLFFQKHIGSLKPDGIRKLDPGHMPGHEPMIAIENRRGLIGAVQMSVIELHTVNALDDDVEHPDRLVFDLDPGEGVSWQQMIEAAAAARIFFEELALRTFLKTSGGKGLHIVMPIERHYGWAEAKDFSRACVEHLARAMPDRFVAKSGPRNRVGRIFIDYLRNGRGATTVAALSARARPGLGVSMPVDWEQLDELTGGDQWRVDNAAAWLEAREHDPWANYADSAQSLENAMATLGQDRAKQKAPAKSAARSSPAKEGAAEKKAPGKTGKVKTQRQRTAAQKAAAKKSPVKTMSSGKDFAAKASGKKTTAKKATAKKTPAKKTTARKAAKKQQG